MDLGDYTQVIRLVGYSLIQFIGPRVLCKLTNPLCKLWVLCLFHSQLDSQVIGRIKSMFLLLPKMLFSLLSKYLMKWICFVCANWPLWFSIYNIYIKVSVWFFLFLWNKCFEIQVLHHMADICLVLEMMPHISKIAEPFYITIAMSGPISLHLY